VGSCAPGAVIPCHASIAGTQGAAPMMPMRRAGLILGKLYHIAIAAAAD